MKSMQVKNRAPAPIQITAEQLLREAKERQDETFRAPQQKITDPEELKEYQISTRKDFEDKIRRQRQHIGTYLKYAKWEEGQLEFRRARSIYERAIDIDYTAPALWIKYAEFEMKNKFVNHARNVWDRAVTLLPRVSQFWYKYTYMEEMLGKIDNARTIFERWMRWEPEEQAWFSYIKLEERAGDMKRARDLLERFCACHITARAYIKYAKWEQKHAQVALCRIVFERALEELPKEECDETLYIAFARFEERCKEFERARALYKLALDQLPKAQARELYNAFVSFEKQHGHRQGVEDVIVAKRRGQYEGQVKSEPANYDAWFDYVRLEEAQVIAEIQASGPDSAVAAEACARAREVYERAIANVPAAAVKKAWKRYIYLWINYALFEELIAKDFGRTRDVFRQCLKTIPHKRFSFSKVWVMFSQFEVRRKDLGAARKVLGQAIGRAPKEKIFQEYIQLESQLYNVDRCRTLYEKYLEFMPENATTWIKFAELENIQEEEERCRAVFELAVSQPLLDMPEMVWKKYIDFEVALGESGYDRATMLYERLLDKTKHVKVWVSFGRFYALTRCMVEEARATLQNGYNALKKEADGMKEERVTLLDGWIEVEQQLLDDKIEGASMKKLGEVKAMMPKKVKKKRQVEEEDGSKVWEEYYDYIFPDDPKQATGLKILEMAQKWKRSGGVLPSLGAKKAKVDEAPKDENELDIE